MKFGVREICDVVFKATAAAGQKVGNTTFAKGEPVLYIDTAKTSSLEGAASTVYATGGKGNTRLLAWEGEKTLTLTIEDALISPLGFSLLSGAGIVDAADETLMVHTVVDILAGTAGAITDTALADGQDAFAFVLNPVDGSVETNLGAVTLSALGAVTYGDTDPDEGDLVRFDFYLEKTSGVQQIEIDAKSFAGYYYVEASTLFRDASTGEDFEAEFIVPNAKVQSNFTFTMAATGDPSTFTFTLDAFPGVVKGGDGTRKVLAALQIVPPVVG